MLQRLARAVYHHRRRVLVGWVLLLAGLVGLNATAGGEFLDNFALPGSESQQAADLLRASGFGDRAGANGQVVFRADQGVDAPAVRQAMTALFAELEAGIPDSQVVSPYDPRAAASAPGATRGSPTPGSTWATATPTGTGRPPGPPATWSRRSGCPACGWSWAATPSPSRAPRAARAPGSWPPW